MHAPLLSLRSFPVFLHKHAIATLFIWFGIATGSWAGRIPALREGIQASYFELSLVLLCGALGAALSYPVSSGMMAKVGDRKTMQFAGLGLLIALAAIGAAPGVPLLMLAVLSFGIAASTFDAALNSLAARQEAAGSDLRLSRLQGWGWAGGFIGVMLGGAMAKQNIAPFSHFLLIAVPLAVVLWLSCRSLKESWVTGVCGEAAVTGKTLPASPGPSVALFGFLGFLGAVIQGSIMDWSGIFLKDHFRVTDGLAPMALGVSAVTMLLSLAMSSYLKEKYGTRCVLAASSLLCASGLLLAAFAPGLFTALTGFALSGFGMALIFPFVFAAAARQGSPVLASVAAMSCIGSVAGPPILGAAAHILGIQAAIAFPALLSVIIAIIATRSAQCE